MQTVLDGYATPSRIWKSLTYEGPHQRRPSATPRWPLQIAWADVLAAIDTVDEALRLALEATTEGFSLWQIEGAGETNFGDEFSLSPSQVAALTAEWRLAYVGRLLRTIAVSYGLQTEFGGGTLGEPRNDDLTDLRTVVTRLSEAL